MMELTDAWCEQIAPLPLGNLRIPRRTCTRRQALNALPCINKPNKEAAAGAARRTASAAAQPARGSAARPSEACWSAAAPSRSVIGWRPGGRKRCLTTARRSGRTRTAQWRAE